jgi:hypothetical protein
MSAYLPGISRPSATVKFPELHSIGSGYDGGFTRGLPCPPGEPNLIASSKFISRGTPQAQQKRLLPAQKNRVLTECSSSTLRLTLQDQASGLELLQAVPFPEPRTPVWRGHHSLKSS